MPLLGLWSQYLYMDRAVVRGYYVTSQSFPTVCNNMRFPKRDDNHLMETQSGRLLASFAPDDWILRQVTERDYGIDYYIELASKDGEITGDLLSVQLKSIERIDWKTSAQNIETARSPSIKVETANYWLGLPVPVLLLVADLSAGDIYVTNVKPTLRADFEKLQTQGTLTFPLHKPVSLKSEIGPIMVRIYYARERHHARFKAALTTLLSNLTAHADFILYNQMLDCFMEVETARHLEFRSLYIACAQVAQYLGVKWELPKLVDVYFEDHETWKSNYCFLHEQSLDRVLKLLQPIYPKLLRGALDLVTQTERHYWRATNPYFYALCADGELKLSLNQIEMRFTRDQ